MTTYAQPDLFGEFDAAEQHEADRQRRRTDWTARFERADWIAPYDTADGTKAGDVVRGWRCPDPDCGAVEPNAYLLSINHGFDPEVPGQQPLNSRCWRSPRRGAPC